jgi:peptidoglycan hydrolase-like protein with peptidoglycan-binding domain/N-acetylmuramoyl-L-alanine amidase CwlA
MRKHLIKHAAVVLIFLLSFSIAPLCTYASAGKPILKEGMSGSAVKTLQSNLKRLGFFSQSPTGFYGDNTVSAVKKFQKKYKIPATGVVATLTYNKLDALLKPAAPKKAPTKGTPSKNTQKPVSSATQKPAGLKKGSSGKEVLKLQNNLALLGYMKVTPTGDFGPITKLALTQFQKYYGLDESGVADSKTLSVIDRLLGQTAGISRGGDVDRGDAVQAGAAVENAAQGNRPQADFKLFSTVKQEWISGLPQAPFLKGVGKYEGVVIHYTASPNDTAETEADHERKHWQNAFVHEFIDPDEIIQVADPDYKAWGAGERANDRFIHLEMCDAANQDEFNIIFNKVTLRASEYLYINKLGVIPAKADGTGTLWSHMDVTNYLGFTNHTDPIAYLAKWGKTWNDVISTVTLKYNALASGKDPEAEAKAAADANAKNESITNEPGSTENNAAENNTDGNAGNESISDENATDRDVTNESTIDGDAIEDTTSTQNDITGGSGPALEP